MSAVEHLPRPQLVNSSPRSAVLPVSEDTDLATIRSWRFALRNPSSQRLAASALSVPRQYRESIPLRVRSITRNGDQVTVHFNRPVDPRLVLVDGDREQSATLAPGYRGRSGDTPLFIPSRHNSDADVASAGSIGTSSTSSDSIEALINLDAFRAKYQCYGQGVAVAVIDTGARLTHNDFKNDSGASRIIYDYDFGDNDPDATDVNGHGTNVTGIIGARSTGIAPQVNLIILKVFTNKGSATTAKLEDALQWIENNRVSKKIVSINMSLGDYKNWDTPSTPVGVDDEIERLAQNRCIPIAAAGNYFYDYESEQGISYPAADPYCLSVGAVFDRNQGSTNNFGAQAYSSAADVIAPFSQRHSAMLNVFAPGVMVVSTGKSNDTASSTYTGTSQATPHIAAAVALAQELAHKRLNRWLSFDEVRNLLTTSGRRIVDGDDENDNIRNTGLAWKRIDMLALGDAIAALGGVPVTTPPNAPSNLQTSSVTSNTIGLRWQDQSNNETGFQILCATDGAFTQNTRWISVGRNTTSHTDTGLNPSTRYYYKVRARKDDQDSNKESAWSNAVNATTAGQVPVTNPPNAPSNLQTSSVTSTAIGLRWQDQSNNETGFQILCATDGAFTQNTRWISVGRNTTSHTDTGLNPSTRYYYKVRARKDDQDSNKESAWSNAVNATTSSNSPITHEDLALFATARWGTPSTTWTTGQNAAACVDDNDDTGVGTYTGNNAYQWIGVDLGATFAVDQVDLIWRDKRHRAVDYVIEGGTQPDQWQPIVTVDNSSVTERSHPFQPQMVRYLRIKVIEGGLAYLHMPNRVYLQTLAVFGEPPYSAQ